MSHFETALFVEKIFLAWRWICVTRASFSLSLLDRRASFFRGSLRAELAARTRCVLGVRKSSAEPMRQPAFSSFFFISGFMGSWPIDSI